MLRNKKKEMEVFVQMLALTNFTILVKKGIVTAEEWKETSEETIEALMDVQRRNGDFSDVIEELQRKEDEKKNKLE